MLKLFGNGNITKDATLRKVKVGDTEVSVCDFNVAMKRDLKGDDTEFVRVTLWRAYAEKMAQYATKGRHVVLEGTPKVSIWMGKDGKANATITLANPSLELVGANPAKSAEPGPDDITVEVVPEELPFD